MPGKLCSRQHHSLLMQEALQWVHGSPVAVRRKLLTAAVEDCQLQASPAHAVCGCGALCMLAPPPQPQF